MNIFGHEVLSHNMQGFQAMIKIPVSEIGDMSEWDSTDFSGLTGITVGRDFDVISSSEYVISGSRFGTETILSVLSENNRDCKSLSFWPEDGYKGEPIAALTMAGSKYMTGMEATDAHISWTSLSPHSMSAKVF